MTNEELQKAFEAGYAAAKALYSLLEKEGIDVTEADIRRIVEEVIGELAENGQIGWLEGEKTVLTFDGNTDGKSTVTVDAQTFVRISNEAVDLYSVTKLIGVDASSGETADLMEEFGGALQVVDLGTATVITIGVRGTFVYSITEGFTANGITWETGVYVLCHDGMYISRIEAGTETITPMSDKFLPSVCLPVVIDFDGLGLTNTILELINAGGGRTDLYSESVNVESIRNGFPSNGDYIAKLTIPDMGVMYVNPVYTSFNESGLVVAHFDSYLMGNGEMTKFYVRILPATSVSAICIYAGFYT